MRVGIKRITTSDGWVKYTSADDSEVFLAFRNNFSLSNSPSNNYIGWSSYYENYDYNIYHRSRLLSNAYREYRDAICISFLKFRMSCSRTLKLSYTICSFETFMKK